MFDKNEFKKQVKTWIKEHPRGDVQDLVDFCEELIPPKDFSSNQWLINQTVTWYKQVLANRENAKKYSVADENIC